MTELIVEAFGKAHVAAEFINSDPILKKFFSEYGFGQNEINEMLKACVKFEETIKVISSEMVTKKMYPPDFFNRGDTN